MGDLPGRHHLPLLLWARDPAKAEARAAQLAERLGIEVEARADVASAVADADIIVTATPAVQPILEAGQLRAGQHITAMGSDAEHKNEIDPRVFTAGIEYFCDRLAQTRLLGELHHAIAQGLVPADAEFAEIGQVVAQQRPARRERDDITLCDLTGTGIQDTAIATLAFRRCRQQQAGTRITT